MKSIVGLLALVFVLVCALALVGQVTASSSNATYDAAVARKMLDFAGAAYCHPKQIQKWTCTFCRENPDFNLTGTYLNRTTNMQTIVGYSPSTNSVVVVFKGTSPLSITNWLQDLTFGWIVYDGCPGCAVHSGFYETYMSVRGPTLQLLEQARAAFPNAKLTITGHSLGGALTLMAAVDLAVSANLIADMVVTFGQPRLGNPAFRAFYQSTFSRTQSWRVTHGTDPVPHLPLLAMGFKHHATEEYYSVLNDAHQTCDGSGEDPNCANQWPISVGVLDHITYLSGDFLPSFMACQIFAESIGDPIRDVVRPNSNDEPHVLRFEPLPPHTLAAFAQPPTTSIFPSPSPVQTPPQELIALI